MRQVTPGYWQRSWLCATPLWLWVSLVAQSVVLAWLLTHMQSRSSRPLTSADDMPFKTAPAMLAPAAVDQTRNEAERPSQLPAFSDDPTVAVILAPANEVDYPARTAALETIFTRRTMRDWQRLHALMNDPVLLQDLAPAEQMGLLQLIADFLLREDPDRKHVVASMVQCLQDTRYHPVAARAWLRHADLFYDRPGEHAALTVQLWTLVEHIDGSVADAALAALTRIAFKSPEIDRQRLGEVVQEIFDIPFTAPELQIVALEAGAWLNVSSTFARAQQLTVDVNAPSAVRLTAIAVLAEHGNAGDIAILEQLAKSSFPPVSDGARAAATHLQQRRAKQQLSDGNQSSP